MLNKILISFLYFLLLYLHFLALIVNIINAQYLCSEYQYASQHTDIEFDEDFCSMLVPSDNGATHCCYEEINDNAVGCKVFGRR